MSMRLLDPNKQNINGQRLTSYSEAIQIAFEYLLEKYPEVFILGQGVWSPWYVGTTMKDLDKKFGKERVIDSPVSEWACTGLGVGASLFGYKPIIIHPRMDFMVLASDPLVNQAAKWSYMLGGQANPQVTIRAIINRGGEQGAQHSQALHSWYAHIPGLRVVMPSTPKDARDLLIASVLCKDPVIYIDDRWLYDQKEMLSPIEELDLSKEKPQILKEGKDITIVGSSYSSYLAMQAAKELEKQRIFAEVIDLRILNPIDYNIIVKSVEKTNRLMVVDGSWKNCGIAGEVIASVVERIDPRILKSKPSRITLPDSPAPTSKVLEDIYYPKIDRIVQNIELIVKTPSKLSNNIF